eukprot:154145-Rhodomonas_salina.1
MSPLQRSPTKHFWAARAPRLAVHRERIAPERSASSGRERCRRNRSSCAQSRRQNRLGPGKNNTPPSPAQHPTAQPLRRVSWASRLCSVARQQGRLGCDCVPNIEEDCQLVVIE